MKKQSRKLLDMVNPFKESSELLNIVNATVPPDEVTLDLMQAHSRGEDAYKQFRLQQLHPCMSPLQ